MSSLAAPVVPSHLSPIPTARFWASGPKDKALQPDRPLEENVLFYMVPGMMQSCRYEGKNEMEDHYYSSSGGQANMLEKRSDRLSRQSRQGSSV